MTPEYEDAIAVLEALDALDGQQVTPATLCALADLPPDRALAALLALLEVAWARGTE